MLERRFCLYMDMLGTKQIIDSGAYDHLIEIVQSFSSNSRPFGIDYKELFNQPDARYEVSNMSPTISNFSDHIAASYPSTYSKPPFNSVERSSEVFIRSLVMVAVQVHQLAFQRGVLVRGALTEGELFHDGSSIIGSALNEADELERNVAKFPRVVISENVMNLLSEYNFNYTNILSKDFDDKYYIKYFDFLFFGVPANQLISCFINIRKTIEKNLHDSDIIGNRNRFLKWRWLAQKFNEHLSIYQAGKIEKLKEEFSKICEFNIPPIAAVSSIEGTGN